MWKEHNVIARFKNKILKKPSGKIKDKVITIDGKCYHVKPVRYRDISRLLTVERVIYTGKVPWDATAFIMELSSSDPHLYLHLVYEDETIGFIGCRVQDEDAHITNFAVLPAYQNLGLGTCLLEEVRAYALAKGCQTLSLEVRVDNKAAQRLYRRHGFVSRSIKPNYYHVDQEDALDMVCTLEGE